MLPKRLDFTNYIYCTVCIKNMSFVRFKKENQLQQQPSSKTPAVESDSGMSMRIDVVPIPTGTSGEVDMSLKEKQNAAIQTIEQKGRDLFRPNKAVVTQTAGTKLYQTSDLFGQVLAVEDLIPLMTESNLTLRLNAVREGAQAHTTCMELKSGALADLLEAASDSKREKSTEVTIQSNPDAGKMYVGLKLSNGKHYIQKLDYEISQAVDDSLHLK